LLAQTYFILQSGYTSQSDKNKYYMKNRWERDFHESHIIWL